MSYRTFPQASPSPEKGCQKLDRQLDLRVLDGEATVSELGFEPQHGEDVNLGGREWLSTWYMRTFPHNDRPALSIQGSRFERPLRRLWTESWWNLGLAGLVAKGRPCSSRGEAARALFQALGWDPTGEGRRCVLWTRRVALPGDPGISASERRGFVKHRESPWKRKGTLRRPRGGRRVHRPRPLFPLGPRPCSRACREL